MVPPVPIAMVTPIADNLAHIVDTLHDVHCDMQVVGAREWVAMRDVQDSTNSRAPCSAPLASSQFSSMADGGNCTGFE